MARRYLGSIIEWAYLLLARDLSFQSIILLATSALIRQRTTIDVEINHSPVEPLHASMPSTLTRALKLQSRYQGLIK
jgi:hypothetical protein